MKTSELLIQYAIKYSGSWDAIARAVKENETVRPVVCKDQAVTIMDPQYPGCLRLLRYPPWVLFYKGDLSLLSRPMITIVGSRILSSYGRNMTRKCAEILRDQFVLVSGLAKGADGEVHRTALQHGHTIGVIGSGLGYQYPSENRDLYSRMAETDLILSEYPHDTGVQRYHFPWRNRILAALGEAIIVTQAELRSGTALTVNEAVELGKDIWCIPYPLNERMGAGCNKMIADGANILWDLSILRDFKPGQNKY